MYIGMTIHEIPLQTPYINLKAKIISLIGTKDKILNIPQISAIMSV